MPKILILNGPNLNLLGTREPEIYGSTRLDDVIESLANLADQHHVELKHLQSNQESELIEAVHQAAGDADFIIINPAAFTHTSVALRDALLGVGIPFIEVHLSNTHKRESFRQQSYFSDIAEGVIMGLGVHGYELALHAAISKLNLNG